MTFLLSLMLLLLLLLSNLNGSQLNDNTCACLHNAECKSTSNQMYYCLCPPLFLGERCQHSANQLTNAIVDYKISSEYRFFYQQFSVSSYYAFRFQFCIDKLSSVNYQYQIQILKESQNGSIELSDDANRTLTYQPKSSSECIETEILKTFIFEKGYSGELRKIVLAIRHQLIAKKQAISSKLEINDDSLSSKALNEVEPLKEEDIMKIRCELKNLLQSDISLEPLLFVGVGSITFLSLVFLLMVRKMMRRRYRLQWPRYELRTQSNNIEHLEEIMPSMKYSDLIADSHIDPLHQCSICLLTIQSNELARKTPCSHVFHVDCIDSWCKNKLNCPVCRNELVFRESRVRTEIEIASEPSGLREML